MTESRLGPHSAPPSVSLAPSGPHSNAPGASPGGPTGPNSSPPKGKTRLFIIDDSSANRRVLAHIFEGDPEVEVVGEAGDGEEALRLVTQLKPDIITLDLEMPRMDGFTFLRILMAKQPTPTIVVSSFAQRENVFKALELGALDFVAKADRQISSDAHELERQVRTKVHGFRRSSSVLQIVRNIAAREKKEVRESAYTKPSQLVVIAASTGGPSALLEIFGAIPRGSNIGIVVAQHMPDKFTRTFAERLDRKGAIRTREAENNDVLAAGMAFVCPGRRNVELDVVADELRLRVRGESPGDRYLPSADVLFNSAVKAAATMRIPVIGVVLTGMGDDGVEGARAIAGTSNGRVVVESRDTAVVYGMPREVIERKIRCEALPLPKIVETIAKLA